MHFPAALALAAVAPLAAAFNVMVESECPFTVYGWNVLDSYGQDAPLFTLTSGQSWTGPFEERDDNGGGACVKLKNTSSIFDGGPVNQIEYKMSAGTLFYDLSDINGNIFAYQAVSMVTANSACPNVECSASEAVCSAAYLHPDDLRTLACPGGSDITVSLCKGGSSGGGSSAPPKPAAPPAPTTLQAAPKPPATTAAPNAGGNFLEKPNDGGVDIVYETVVMSTTVTVKKSGPAPTDIPKRSAHLHAHAARGRSRVAGRHAHLL